MAHPQDTAVGAPYGVRFAGRTVLVTGAYGLLGSRLSAALVDRGARVLVVRRRPRPTSALVLEGTEGRCTVLEGDLLDEAFVERAVAAHGVDTVLHLAAQPIVDVADRSPRATLESNVAGTWNVLEACRLAGVARTVVAASVQAYGPSDVVPYTEDLPLRATHPYDVSKAAADLIARSYWTTYGLPVAVTRFASVYGGGDQHTSRLVPGAIAAVLAGRAPALRSDGSPERDLLYVEDAVDAYLAICDLLDVTDGPPGRGEAFVAGGGTPHRVVDVVRLICRLAGRPDLEPEVRGTGRPGGTIDRRWVDASRLRGLTGWEPRVGLEDGLRRTIDWYRAHPGGLAPA